MSQKDSPTAVDYMLGCLLAIQDFKDKAETLEKEIRSLLLVQLCSVDQGGWFHEFKTGIQ